MSKMKNFDPALYKSHFDAVKSIIQKGHVKEYDFPVCSKEAAEAALIYLCVNEVPHHYHTVGALDMYCVTIGWEEEDGDYAYCFWCEGEI